MIRLIELLLTLIALYTGGSWTWCLFSYLTLPAIDKPRIDHQVLNQHLFMLGLCCILALGFLGLLIK